MPLTVSPLGVAWGRVVMIYFSLVSRGTMVVVIKTINGAFKTIRKVKIMMPLNKHWLFIPRWAPVFVAR